MRLTDLPLSFLTAPLAHRGLHGAEIPENSRASFMAAIEHGYGIELDLQLSADGEAMVFHDYNLKRLTGVNGPIRQQTAAALANLKLANGEGIPTLSDVLNLVAGRAPLLVEIKDQDGILGPNVGELEARTAEVIANYSGPLALMSFNPHAVYALQKLAPTVPRGLTTRHFTNAKWPLVPAKRLAELDDIPDFEACGATFLSHHHETLNMPRVAEIKATGVPILCWTVKNETDSQAAKKIADNITFEGYLP